MKESTGSERLVAIECNPRATSGIHLWSGTPHLANVFASAVDPLKKLILQLIVLLINITV